MLIDSDDDALAVYATLPPNVALRHHMASSANLNERESTNAITINAGTAAAEKLILSDVLALLDGSTMFGSSSVPWHRNWKAGDPLPILLIDSGIRISIRA